MMIYNVEDYRQCLCQINNISIYITWNFTEFFHILHTYTSYIYRKFLLQHTTSISNLVIRDLVTNASLGQGHIFKPLSLI